MVSKKRAWAMMLIGTLLCAGCTPHVQFEQRIAAVEDQLGRTRATPPAPTRYSPTWKERFDSIPRGATYATVVQAVGKPTHIERDRNLAVCVYYVSDDEVFVLVFDSGSYTQGYVDTYSNWMRVFVRSGHSS